MTPRVPFMSPVLRDRFLMQIRRKEVSIEKWSRGGRVNIFGYRGTKFEVQLVDAQAIWLQSVQELGRVCLSVPLRLSIARLEVVRGEVAVQLPWETVQDGGVHPVHISVEGKRILTK